ncbi:hypothetical protein LB523_28500 [Mesorhizobium sp. ESP-6-4]|uniref:hypothetical protein n=1 Tax=Mesorhizobium sp. ESP-6-4 TaxID=2876624 RepID=UPI001CCF04CB|nr:hypothetical protein [Mesorhizobium sp. ESP-6-4]MBZ9662993.1 hypothetical protein [Mesorhizobium sp. ESP-6-4]
MSSTLAWIFAAVIAAVVIWALIMGRRFLRGRLRFGHFEAGLEGRQEARVSDSTGEGTDIKIRSDGEGAVVDNVRARGSRIEIGSSTTGAAPQKDGS